MISFNISSTIGNESKLFYHNLLLGTSRAPVVQRTPNIPKRFSKLTTTKAQTVKKMHGGMQLLRTQYVASRLCESSFRRAIVYIEV